MTLPIAILAGGLATRLGDLTRDKPKSLIEILGKPFVDWQLELLKKNGYSNVILCLSHKSMAIQEYLGDGSRYGIQIRYSIDGSTQLGTGGAIKKALPLLGKEFAVLYGDSYLPTDFWPIEEFFRKSSCLAVMAIYKNVNQFDKSNVELKSEGYLKYEKNQQSSKMNFIDYGLTYYRNSAFDQFESREAFDLAEVCRELSSRNQLQGVEVLERFYEIGSLSGIADFTEFLGKANHEFQ